MQERLANLCDARSAATRVGHAITCLRCGWLLMLAAASAYQTHLVARDSRSHALLSSAATRLSSARPPRLSSPGLIYNRSVEGAGKWRPEGGLGVCGLRLGSARALGSARGRVLYPDLVAICE